MDNIEKLKNWIEDSHHIVFFGGAGVSTESGIPDFRSVDGLYNQVYDYPPETILSHTFFETKTKEFYRFYHDKLNITGAKPNAAHIALAKLEQEGKLSAVITQNIDGLHQAAGSKVVLELHGSLLRNYCVRCGKRYTYEHILTCGEDVPLCSCGGMLRPDVVLYEENLNEGTMRESVRLLRNADMLIVGGTSLAVYPAAGLINYYSGNRLVLINRDATSYDRYADLLINEKIGEVFSKIR